jgi:hypothetical protein
MKPNKLGFMRKVICDYRDEESPVCEVCKHGKPHPAYHRCDELVEHCQESQNLSVICRPVPKPTTCAEPTHGR